MRASALLLLCLCGLAACRPVWEESGWMGHSDAELEREVGVPTSSNVFQLTRESGRLQLGYREGLSRFAPTAAGEALPVKEMLWKDRFSTRVAWLRRDASGVWRVFDTLGWRADVAF